MHAEPLWIHTLIGSGVRTTTEVLVCMAPTMAAAPAPAMLFQDTSRRRNGIPDDGSNTRASACAPASFMELPDSTRVLNAVACATPSITATSAASSSSACSNSRVLRRGAVCNSTTPHHTTPHHTNEMVSWARAKLPPAVPAHPVLHQATRTLGPPHPGITTPNGKAER